MHPLQLLVALCHLVSLSYAAELRLQLSASNLIANPSTLPSSTHATLIGSFGELRALLRNDNTILFSEIPSVGSHLLKVYTRDFVFAPYRVDIVKAGDGTQISAIYETYPGTLWSDHGVALIPVNSPVATYTLVPRTVAKKNFYEERPSFQILTLLKNPMILLGGVALLFTFGMPKLMESMDPEMRAEFEEMQKTGPTAGLSRAMAGQSSGGSDGFDLAGFLAGSGSKGSKTTARAPADNIRERKR